MTDSKLLEIRVKIVEQNIAIVMTREGVKGICYLQEFFSRVFGYIYQHMYIFPL